MSRDKFYEIFMMVLTFIFSIATCIWGFTWADSIFTYACVILLTASTIYFGYWTVVVIVDAIKENQKNKKEKNNEKDSDVIR